MDNLMETITKFLNIYNNVSEKKLSYQEFITIFPKFVLITNNISLDIIEMIDLTDTLIEFEKYHQLAKINEETVLLIKKITENKFYNLEGSLYFSKLLKHLLMPFNLNKCDKDYETFLHISTFETLLELIIGIFNDSDYSLLQTYNCELNEIVLQYKKNIYLYKKKINNEIMLSTILSHLYSIFYFNQIKYNSDYCILDLVVNNSINNYQQFVNYCYYEGISDNFTKMVLEKKEIQKEYAVSQKMLDYTFDNLNKEKDKKRC